MVAFMAGRDDFFVPETVELRVRTKTGDNKICVVGNRRNSSRRLWIWAGANAWRKQPPAHFEPQRSSYASVSAAIADAGRIFPTPGELARFIEHGFNGETFREEDFSAPFVPTVWSSGPEPVPSIDVASLFDISRDVKRYERPSRPYQSEFRRSVFERYGLKCALCRIDSEPLLDAAHIIAWKDNGANMPENGLVLCKLHHCAVDSGMIAIEPVTLELFCRDSGFTLEDLHIEVTDLTHLRHRPDQRALRWLWDQRESPK